ncbi:hypothetical protein ABIA39_006973 [Nocardia sp. GAS34]|uniref:hypothetical protein n=1 Tax=unclassified Nocardia TaxID=2637762 RepID=UPI003D2220EA
MTVSFAATRCRRLTKAFATRTVVFTGRHRTREERIDSWRRGDRCRGGGHQLAPGPPGVGRV